MDTSPMQKNRSLYFGVCGEVLILQPQKFGNEQSEGGIQKIGLQQWRFLGSLPVESHAGLCNVCVESFAG